jgi:hypothetical protein
VRPHRLPLEHWAPPTEAETVTFFTIVESIISPCLPQEFTRAIAPRPLAKLLVSTVIGREIWNRRYPDNPVEYTPYLSWGDQQDLKLAKMKKLREEEEERSRAAASADPPPASQDGPR